MERTNGSFHVVPNYEQRLDEMLTYKRALYSGSECQLLNRKRLVHHPKSLNVRTFTWCAFCFSDGITCPIETASIDRRNRSFADETAAIFFLVSAQGCARPCWFWTTSGRLASRRRSRGWACRSSSPPARYGWLGSCLYISSECFFRTYTAPEKCPLLVLAKAGFYDRGSTTEVLRQRFYDRGSTIEVLR